MTIVACANRNTTLNWLFPWFYSISEYVRAREMFLVLKCNICLCPRSTLNQQSLHKRDRETIKRSTKVKMLSMIFIVCICIKRWEKAFDASTYLNSHCQYIKAAVPINRLALLSPITSLLWIKGTARHSLSLPLPLLKRFGAINSQFALALLVSVLFQPEDKFQLDEIWR